MKQRESGRHGEGDRDVITTPGGHYQGRNLLTVTLDSVLRSQSSLNSEHISTAVQSTCQPVCLSVCLSAGVG